VVLFNANSLGGACGGIELDDGTCVTAIAPGSYSCLYLQDSDYCEYVKSNYGLKYCYNHVINNVPVRDCFAAAVVQCGGMDKMMTTAQWIELAGKLYDNFSPPIGTNKNLTYRGNASNFGLPEPVFQAYTGKEYYDDVMVNFFNFTTTSIGGGGTSRNSPNYYMLCAN
ncbi:MAG: hypothetical protein LUE64_03345, partial [Candidatus Gastranaerophilales bacterium]|nr:hypothetical protein [Candidatus Gastranaerophilales bacterium]